jgi:hypothetical protein
MYDWLAQHPQIYAHPLAKDYPYFSDDNLYEKEHKQFMSFSNGSSSVDLVLGGDANAMFVDVAAARMYREMPNARLIAILRNPVDRAYSAYCHAVERLFEGRSFDEAIQEELQGCSYSAEDSAIKKYLAHGCYAGQLERIFSMFSARHVAILFFDDLKQNPSRVLMRTYRFLGVDDNFLPNLRVSNETRGGQRYKWLAKVAYGGSTSNTLRRVVRAAIPFEMRTMVRRKLRAWNRVHAIKPQFTEQTRRLLLDYYRPENKKLADMLGVDLARWEI